jgi:hypothetical protein
MLDELQHREVVGTGVGDVSGFGVGRDHQGRDSGSVIEEIQGLHVPVAPVPAARVEGDDDRSVFPQFFIGLDAVNAVAEDWRVRAKFGPGVPFSFTIPFESRLSTLSPALGL